MSKTDVVINNVVITDHMEDTHFKEYAHLLNK